MELREALDIHFSNLSFGNLYSNDDIEALRNQFDSLYDAGMFDFYDEDIFMIAITPGEFLRFLSVQALKNVTLRDACASTDCLSEHQIEKIPYTSAYYEIATLCLNMTKLPQ